MNSPIRIKEVRRRILQNLEIVYPSGLTIRSLYLTVCAIDETYDLNLFKKDVTYLRDKGYILFVDDIFGGMSDYDKKVVRLTAQGKEISEQTMFDKALEI